MSERQTIAELEQTAEAAYAAMYDAKAHDVKDCYDDAQVHFGRAIEAAQLARLPDEVARLWRRVEHITSVYNSQFRGVGR